MDIKMMRLGDLRPYEKNPRKNDEAVKYVAESIKQFGFKVPIVIDKNNVIVAGHTRYKAAKKLNIDTVPCIVADDLTDQQIKAFRLADNKVAEKSEWEFDLLQDELDDLFEFDMTVFGFEDEETEEEPEEVEKDNYEPEIPIELKAKTGDIYQLGKHRLMCGDSTSERDMDTLLDGNFMRLTVTSPPYGVGKDYEEKGILPWRETIGGVINAIKGKTLLIGWNISDLFATGTQFTEPTGAYSIQMMADAGYGMLYNRIWKKPGANFAGNNPYYRVTTKPAQDYEYLFCFAEKDSERHLESIKRYLFSQAKSASITDNLVKSLGGPASMCGHWFTNHQWSFIDEKNYNRLAAYCTEKGIDAFRTDYDYLRMEYLRNTIFSRCLSDDEFSEWGLYGVWEFNTVHERLGGHAAAFPIELPARYIKMHSYIEDMVLDPFGGTGTTMIACEQLNRKCFMMERDPHYVDVIIDRWEQYTGEKAVLLNANNETIETAI